MRLSFPVSQAEQCKDPAGGVTKPAQACQAGASDRRSLSPEALPLPGVSQPMCGPHSPDRDRGPCPHCPLSWTLIQARSHCCSQAAGWTRVFGSAGSVPTKGWAVVTWTLDTSNLSPAKSSSSHCSTRQRQERRTGEVNFLPELPLAEFLA